METSAGADIAASKQRIFILDALRGFALLGILLMNIPFFGLPEQTVSNLNIRNEYSGINYYVWWVINMFFEGSMRGLFSMLFGAGMILLTDRLSAKGAIDSAAEIYYRRLIWLLIFGFVDAFLFLWPGDILYSYAICGLFLFPLKNIKPKYLFIISGILLVFLTAKLSYQRAEPLRTKKKAELALKIDTSRSKLNDEQKEAIQAWKGFQEKQKIENKRKEVEKEVKKTKGSYATLVSHYTNINVFLQTSDFYQSGFLDCLIFMIIGMALYKLKILTGERSMRFYVITALIGYSVAMPLIYWKLSLSVAEKFDVIRILEKSTIYTYELRRLGLTFGHLALLVAIYKSGTIKWPFQIWAKVGQMAFSNYLLQNILCGLFFYGFAFNHFNDLERYELYGVVAVVWVINIIFSYIWLRFFTIGPFEWIWRSLTYWKPQPLWRHRA